MNPLAQALAAAGLHPSPDGSYTVETRAGKYTFIVTGTSLIGRFHDPAKAHRIFRCNPYSGRGDFHDNNGTPEELVERVLQLRKQATPIKPNQNFTAKPI